MATPILPLDPQDYPAGHRSILGTTERRSRVVDGKTILDIQATAAELPSVGDLIVGRLPGAVNSASNFTYIAYDFNGRTLYRAINQATGVSTVTATNT